MNINNLLKGSVLLMFDSFAKKLIGLFSTLILARVLSPEDFGIVAIMLIIAAFFETFTNLGTSDYIICARRPTRDLINTSFTLNLLIRVSLSILMLCSADVFVRYFDDQRLYALIYFYALLMTIGGLENPALHLLKRTHNYKPIIKITILAKFISVIITIFIALVYQSYWALVLGTATSIFIQMIGSYFVHSHRPKICFAGLQAQWAFSKWLIPQGFLGFGRVHLDTFIASSIFGKSSIGAYNTMKYIAFIPSMNIVQPMTGTLLAQLSRIGNNTEHLRSRYDSSLILTLLICLPMTVFLYFNSELVVHVLLGPQWIEFHSLFGWFSLFIFSLSIQHSANRLFIMNKNTRPIFIFEICSIGIILTPLFLLNFDSIQAFTQLKVSIEVCLCIAYFLVTYIRFFNLKQLLRIAGLIISLSMVTILCQYVSSLWYVENMYLLLVLKSILFGACYVLCIYLWLLVVRSTFIEVNYIYQLFADKITPILNKFKGQLADKKS